MIPLGKLLSTIPLAFHVDSLWRVHHASEFLCERVTAATPLIEVGLGILGEPRYDASMRRILLMALLGFTTGCSNAPIAGFLDCVTPSRGRGEGNRGPVVPEPRAPGQPIDNLPPADVTPSITPRP